jgi:signal transduction histidine kinase/CheY-like chemotaxis protein
MQPTPLSPNDDRFRREVEQRFGVLPNFFLTAQATPGLMAELWTFAKAAYLDNPLPARFKERLFVHLSRFCPVRYCVVRHAGFLLGLGRAAGDASEPPASVEEVEALLSRPVPDASELSRLLDRLENEAPAAALPAAGSDAERVLFDALTAVFVDAPRAAQARAAVRHAHGEASSELLMAFLAFVRTAHFWTETHPELEIEPDMRDLMGRHPRLRHLLLDDSDAYRARSIDAMRGAFDELRESLRETDARQTFLLRLADTLRPLSDPGRVQVSAARALGEHLAASRCQYCEALPDEDTLLWGPGYEVNVLHLAGHIRISDFDPEILTLFRAGGTLVIHDIADQIRDPAKLAAFAGAQIRAALAVPLVKDGRLVAVLSLHHAQPRRWTDSQVKLAEEVAERTWAAVERARAEAALRQSEASLQEADRRKDEFLATLAHELRNPLAPIRNALHLLRVASDRVSMERVHGMLDRQVTHMVRLLDELLEVSRISRGVIELQRRRLDLAAVVADAVEASRPSIEHGGHALTVTLPPEPVCVEGDAMRLAQVLSNLLNNAARYTDPGGRIALALRQASGEAVVEVSDSGIGIAPEKLADLFTMFGQIDRRDPRSQGGLGIGLALAQRLAQMHGGRVEAASEGPGRGSLFTLVLPLAPDKPGDKPPERPTAGAHGPQPRRVLVIDDNQDAADSTAMLLGVLGAQPHVAYDGESGLAALKTWRPDLVLLDLGMPGMDGFEVARRIRADAETAALPVVALTGWGQQQDRQRTHDAGFDRHLVKPADPQALQAVLEAFR